MINHIVIFKFKPNVTEDNINNVITQLGETKKLIPTMKHFSFGKNCSIENLNKDYTYAMSMIFDDSQARDAYVNHSEHKRIASQVIVPLLDQGLKSVVVIDYEFENAK